MASNSIGNTPAVVSGTGTSLARQYGSNCTSGSRLVAIVTHESTSASISVADDINGSWGTPDITKSNSGGTLGSGTSAIFSIANTSGAKPTVTATLGASVAGFMQIYEITNVGGTPTVDSTGFQVEDTGLGVALSFAVTTSVDNCSLINGGTHYASGAGIDTSYTRSYNETAGSAAYHQAEHNADVGTAGAQTITWNGYSTSSGGARMSVVAAAYAPPVGGGGGTDTLMGAICL